MKWNGLEWAGGFTPARRRMGLGSPTSRTRSRARRGRSLCALAWTRHEDDRFPSVVRVEHDRGRSSIPKRAARRDSRSCATRSPAVTGGQEAARPAMIAIPALDLREGAYVQLDPGSSYDDEQRAQTDRSPWRRWRFGAFRLHVVDLDAATGRGERIPLASRVLDAWAGDAQGQRHGLRDEAAINARSPRAPRAPWSARAVEEPCVAFARGVALAEPARGRARRRGPRSSRAAGPRARARTSSRSPRLSELPLAGVLVTAVANEPARRPGSRHHIGGGGGVCAARHRVGRHRVAGTTGALAARGARAAVLGMALLTGALDARAVAEEFHS